MFYIIIMSSALSLYTAISNSSSTVATVESIDVTADDVYVINLDDDITLLTKYQDGLTYTIADGTVNGQTKTIITEDQVDITISTSKGTTRLTGKQPSLEFMFYNNEWHLMSYYLNQFKWFPTTLQSRLTVSSDDYQGQSVAISADGNTVAIGSTDNVLYISRVRIYIRSGSTWALQGDPLLPSDGVRSTDANNDVLFGRSVALSADGNTLVAGGQYDAPAGVNTGAVWVFTRTDGVWTQQGNKLVGTDGVGPASQGSAVAISADGNTLVESGPYDNSEKGAIWIFTRSGSTWTQAGSKKVGSGSVGASVYFGINVAISDDARTIVVGGNGDNNDIGAVWVYTKSGSDWVQQGSKLVGSGYSNQPEIGRSIDLSGDGNVLLVSGNNDSGGKGAVWLYIRSGTTWAQQGGKLTNHLDASGNTSYGTQACLTKDGNTLAISAPSYNTSAGIVMIYLRQGDSWTYSHGLTMTDIGSQPQFGRKVSIDGMGKTVVVGMKANTSRGSWVFV